MALIDKASLLMVPSTYEAGKLYNVLPSGNRAPDNKGGAGYDQTRADFDFDRGSNAAATRINSSGLIEKYRENLALYSQDFNNAAWAKSSILVNSNTEANPIDGNVDADTITASAGTTQKYIGVSNSVNGLFTYSFYAKYISQQFVQMFVGADAGFVANFDLQNGNQSASGCIATIVSAGNGWYRCSVFFTSTIGSGVYISPVDSLSSPRFSTTSSTNSFYLFGAQLENSLVATEYLNSTSVTAKAGVLIDLPRINFDANGENGALLLEPSRKNVVTNSEYVSSSDYVVGNWTGTITTNTTETLSPEGVYNATKFVKAGASDRVYFHNSQPDGAYTGSIYLKAASGSENKTIEISIRRFGGGGGSTSKLVTITNEWQRFDVSASNLTGGTTTAMYISDFSSAGTATDFYSYAMQIEAGSYVSSYIPNHGESGGVTRAADSCSVTGVSDVIGQTEGTLYFECANKSLESNARYFSLSDGTGNNRIDIYHHTSDNIGIYVATSGAAQVNVGNVGLPASGAFKFALGYANNDYVWYVNGTQAGTDTSASVPAQSDVLIAANSDATTNPGGNAFKECILFNERLTNAELATLTTL